MTKDELLKALSKQFGELIYNGSPEAVPAALPTGIMSLDKALSIGGLPAGCITQIVGPEGCGKTSVAATIAAKVLATGQPVVYLDLEHKFPVEFAARIGATGPNFILVRPTSGTEADKVVRTILDNNGAGLIVVDSVGLWRSSTFADTDPGDVMMADVARTMQPFVQYVTPRLHLTNTTVLMVNQYRVKIGGYSPTGQVPMTPMGGAALQYQSSVILDVKKAEVIKEGQSPVGIRIKCTIKKSSVCPPFRQVEWEFRFVDPVGINPQLDLAQVAIDCGVIERSGNTYTYQGEKLGVGRDNAISGIINLCSAQPGLEAELRQKILGR